MFLYFQVVPKDVDEDDEDDRNEVAVKFFSRSGNTWLFNDKYFVIEAKYIQGRLPMPKANEKSKFRTSYNFQGV